MSNKQNKHKTSSFNQNMLKEEKEFRKKQKQTPKQNSIENKQNGPVNIASKPEKEILLYETNRAGQNVRKEEKKENQNNTATRVECSHETSETTYRQPTFHQNVLKEEEAFQRGQKQNPVENKQYELLNTTIKSDSSYKLNETQSRQSTSHQNMRKEESQNNTATRVERSHETTETTYRQPTFHQNVLKEEEVFQREQKQSPVENKQYGASNTTIKSDSSYRLNETQSRQSTLHQNMRKEKNQNNTATRVERSHETVGTTYRQPMFHQNVKKEEAKFQKEQRQTNTVNKLGNVYKSIKANPRQVLKLSIENSDSIPHSSARIVGAIQPKKGELDLKNVYTSGILSYRVAEIEKNIVKASAKYLIATATNGTDTQKGTDFFKDIYMTSGQFICDQVRAQLTHSMIKESNKVLSFYHDLLKDTCGKNGVDAFGIIGNISGYKDVEKMQAGVNRILIAKYGKGIKGTGKIGYANATKFLLINGKKIDPELRKLITSAYKRTAAIQIIKGNSTRFRAVTSFVKSKIRRYLQQTDAGYGLYFILDNLSRTKTLLRSSLFAIRSAAKATEKMVLLTAKASAWTIAKGVKLLPDAVKEAKVTKKITSNGKKVKTRTKKVTNATSRVWAKFRNFQKDPFGIRAGMNKLAAKATNSLKRRLEKTIIGKTLVTGHSVVTTIISGIGRGISALGTLASEVVKMIAIGVLVFIGISIIVSIFTSVVAMFFSLFDFNSHDKDIREACLTQIEQSFKGQTEEIKRLSSQYRIVTINYKSLKDEELYSENEVEIIETTNSAELLSMVTVYFDFDLEKAGKNKVTKYVKELYNGSHLISIVEKPYTYTDSEGKEITVVDADVTLTTYYFNHLFNCELVSNSSSSTGVIAGNEITEQVWNYLRSAGVPAVQAAGIMGNIQGESDFDKDCTYGKAYGLCQWLGKRRESLEALARSKGKPVSDLEVQLEFLVSELGPSNFNSYYTNENNYQRFYAATDPETATSYFMWGWERPGVGEALASLNKRQTAARTYYDSYVNREIITNKESDKSEK